MKQKRFFCNLLKLHSNFLSEITRNGEGRIHYKKGIISEIIIDNPLKRNSLTGRMIYELIEIINDLIYHSKDTIGVIIRGRYYKQHPSSFCSGLDFKLAKSVINTSLKGLEMSNTMTDVLNKFKKSSIISLALIHGPALGGGAELSTACDFRAMTLSSTTEIGFVHAKIGASPGWGGATRLLDIVGRNKALHLLCSAQRLTPKEAKEIQLCDYIIELKHEEEEEGEIVGEEEIENQRRDDSLSQYGHQILQPYIHMPFPGAVKDLKYLIGNLSNLSREEQLLLERSTFQKRWGSEDNSNALKHK